MNSVIYFARATVCILAALAAGLHAQPLTVVHAFGPPSSSGYTNIDGIWPLADLVLSGNTLYGTTLEGGTNSYGTVFAMNADGSGFTVLHAFDGNAADGTIPNKKLVLANGTLYGEVGHGTNVGGYGSIFSMSTNGSNYSLLITLATNTSGDLGNGNGGFVLCGDTIYGSSYEGGISNAGTLFSAQSSGAGGLNVIHYFNIGTDGENPLGTPVLSGGTLYGTARNGGTNGIWGTVFSVSTNGGNFTVLHTFAGSTNDAHNPQGTLVLSGSTLYGTTVYGGTYAHGAVFAINTDGSGYRILHSFNNTIGEGVEPGVGLTQRGNMLYGTTSTSPGSALAGTIFCLNTNGGNFSVLHHFPEPSGGLIGGTNYDGSQVNGALAMSGNMLYGTATYGGVNGSGTVFSLAIVPQITGIQMTGPNLQLNVSNALAATTGTLFTATSLALPVNQWTPVATNPFVNGGNLSFTATNAVTAGSAQQFYLLEEQ